jgi:hypothetical protein
MPAVVAVAWVTVSTTAFAFSLIAPIVDDTRDFALVVAFLAFAVMDLALLLALVTSFFALLAIDFVVFFAFIFGAAYFLVAFFATAFFLDPFFFAMDELLE